MRMTVVTMAKPTAAMPLLMQVHVVVAIMLAMALSLGMVTGMTLTREKRQNYDALLQNKAFVESQINCVLGRGQCDRIGNRIKVLVPEVVRTKECKSCTEDERGNVQKVADHVKSNYPKEWNEIKNTYNDDGSIRLPFSSSPSSSSEGLNERSKAPEQEGGGEDSEVASESSEEASSSGGLPSSEAPQNANARKEEEEEDIFDILASLNVTTVTLPASSSKTMPETKTTFQNKN